jgi:hypothetical protein
MKSSARFRYAGQLRGSPVPLASGWNRCRPASPRVCLDQPSCLPTSRRSRCSIPAGAAPRPAGCGYVRATIYPGPGPNRPASSTVLTAWQSALPLIPGLPWCAASRRLCWLRAADRAGRHRTGSVLGPRTTQVLRSVRLHRRVTARSCIAGNGRLKLVIPNE